MRLYELIQRLEAIRDRMESTFTNEFLKGETDNLIDELKLLSPELSQVLDSKSDEELLKKLKENYPGFGSLPGIGTMLPGTITWPPTQPIKFYTNPTPGTSVPIPNIVYYGTGTYPAYTWSSGSNNITFHATAKV